jgi:hypothetical protein
MDDLGSTSILGNPHMAKDPGKPIFGLLSHGLIEG